MNTPRTASRTELAAALVAAGADFYRRGWCLGTSGNLSARLRESPLELLVTASGVDKGALAQDQLVCVDAEGRVLPGQPLQASAETGLHLAVYRRRGAGSVLHTHSIAGTLLGERFCQKGGFTLADYEMLKGLEGNDSHEVEEFVPVLANDQDMPALGREVARVLDERPACHGFLLAGHGLYTWGRDVAGARRHVEILEFLLELTLRRTQLAPFAG